MPVGPVETEGRTPVVDHQGDLIAEVELLQQRVEVATVLDEPVAARPTVGELVRVPHPDQVGRDASGEASEVGDYVPPQV